MKPLLTFDVSALFTIIRVPVALEIISRKFTEYINQIGIEHFHNNTCFMPRDKVISLLELVLNSQVFSFHGKSYQQLQEAAMGSPVSPVIFKIYCCVRQCRTSFSFILGVLALNFCFVSSLHNICSSSGSLFFTHLGGIIFIAHYISIFITDPINYTHTHTHTHIYIYIYIYIYISFIYNTTAQ